MSHSLFEKRVSLNLTFIQVDFRLVLLKTKIMKTQITVKTKFLRKGQRSGALMILAFLMLVATPTFAQKKKIRKIDKVEMQKRKAEGRIIKGNVSFKNQALAEASIFLKGTNKGEYSNSRGNFTFPLELLDGDVLVVEYLGFEKQEVKITSKTTFLNIKMKEAEESLDVVVLGQSGSKKLFKSKKKN